MEDTDYEGQAKRFLQQFHLTLRVSKGSPQCPSWDDNTHTHGDRYRVTLKSEPKRRRQWPEDVDSISFDFWNSLADKANGKRPTAYDVLSCLSSDASMPTDPDEVVAELGEMKPSQAVKTAEFARKLQGFFTNYELEVLGTIQ